MYCVGWTFFAMGLATLVVVKHLRFEAMPTVVAPEVNALSHMRGPHCL